MEDRISQLPDQLLHRILLNLLTRESVRTSVLSTRWRNLWQSVPGLIIERDDGHDFIGFLDRFLNFQTKLSIHQFTITLNHRAIPCWESLIDQVMNRGVEILKITRSHRSKFPVGFINMCKIPVSLYTCETLVNLHLVLVALDDFDGSEFISLPRLQVMILSSVVIPSDIVLEKLISCSQVLRELKLSSLKVGCLKVLSQNLKSLRLSNLYKRELFSHEDRRVVIDTPNLESLDIKLIPLENITIKSVVNSSSIKICIQVTFAENNDFSNMQTWHKFFVGICSRVTDLSISGLTLETINDTWSKLQHQQQPEFKNLTRLYAVFFPDVSEMLPLYLSSFPNLKSIDLEFYGYPNMEKIANSPIPKCLQTSIENIKIKLRRPYDGQERSPKIEIKFARYFLENATTLKKLTLWLDEEEDVCNYVLEQILTFQNSPFAEVKICGVASNFP